MAGCGTNAGPDSRTEAPAAGGTTLDAGLVDAGIINAVDATVGGSAGSAGGAPVDAAVGGSASSAGGALVDTSVGGSAGSAIIVAPAGSQLGAVPVTPDASTTLSVLDQLSVEVPAGGAAPGATLVITGGATPYVTLPWSPIQSYDLTLNVDGSPTQPLAPITLRFRVFPELLRGDLTPEAQLIVATLNETTADWSELPFQIETDARGISWTVVRAPHLTTFAQFIVGPAQSVFSTPYWRIMFDPDTNGVGLGAIDIQGLAVAYRAVLDAAHDAYVGAGFADPRLPPTSWTKVSVYLQPMVNEGALYNPLTGNILLNSLVANDKESQYEAAHEVFHIFQNAKLVATSMENRKWFVEAAAAYAGDELSTKNGWLAKLMKPRFLRDPIDTSDGKHEYGLGNFIKWAVAQGVDFKTLQDNVFGAWTTGNGPLNAFANTIVAQVGGTCSGSTFAEKYLCFADWLLTDAATPIASASLAQDIADASAEMGDSDASAPGAISVGPWVAAVWTAKIRTTGGSRPVRLIYTNFGGSCQFDAFLVRGDHPGNGQKLVRKTFGSELGFQDVDASDGDTIVVAMTAPDQCSLSLEARDARTCLATTAALNEIAYVCEDSAGKHQLTELPSCVASDTKAYHTYTCSARYGPTAKCIDNYVTMVCPVEAPVCAPNGVGGDAVPLCIPRF